MTSTLHIIEEDTTRQASDAAISFFGYGLSPFKYFHSDLDMDVELDMETLT